MFFGKFAIRKAPLERDGQVHAGWEAAAIWRLGRLGDADTEERKDRLLRDDIPSGRHPVWPDGGRLCQIPQD